MKDKETEVVDAYFDEKTLSIKHFCKGDKVFQPICKECQDEIKTYRKEIRRLLDKIDNNKKNLKQAIKELKYTFESNITVVSKRLLIDTINKIFGDKLIK